MKLPIIVSAVFICVSILQSTFFGHFPVFGLTLNLSLVFLVLLAFTEEKDSLASMFAALAGGITLDLYSSGVFGVWTILFVCLVVIVKSPVFTYVRISQFRRSR